MGFYSQWMAETKQQAPVQISAADDHQVAEVDIVEGQQEPQAVCRINLPEGCPLLGNPVPDGCRFEARFFARMLQEGVLPNPDGGCPLISACKQHKYPGVPGE